MARYRFVRARHSGLGAEHDFPVSALAHVAEKGWHPVDTSEVAPVEGRTVETVLADVGGDRVKAAAALEAERAGQRRKTLIEGLERIANPEED